MASPVEVVGVEAEHGALEGVVAGRLEGRVGVAPVPRVARVEAQHREALGGEGALVVEAEHVGVPTRKEGRRFKS